MKTPQEPRAQEERREFREEAESLFRITFAPVIWAAHFLLCYCTLAVVCAKGGDPDFWRTALVGLTLVALLAITWTGWRAWRQWDAHNTGDYANARGEDEDRHQFLGQAALLLAIISAIGVIYTALPLVLVEGCR
ncbi:hypothetical protein [Tropicimonas isoalkanivorans]|uniref:Transmembrane protein n=1 Tax=Tropicimonas isoalkanivorans TaxID=441112 RepID=A0A1I1EFX2_9RHOB|nr:hypothetical protein [Tropicimonas isoalkanivorans]SFB85927.1 hypothetical protein SAMN04488094_101792 [Tropicimonas isoalkanivorans]